MYAVIQKELPRDDLREITSAPLRTDSPVRLIVACIRGSEFEVIAKNYRHIELLRAHFRDVREQDPASYLLESVNQ